MQEKKSPCTYGSEGKKRIVYSCSGIGSNVGQIAHATACRLALEGFGEGSCLAGVGAGIEKLKDLGKTADERIVIDGCPVGCAKKIMDNKGLTINRYVMITELGFVKTSGPTDNENDIQTVVDAVRNPSR